MHVENIHAGLENLSRSQKALAAFAQVFAAIEALCQACGQLGDGNNSIGRLARAHSNIMQSLTACESVSSLPKQAAEAQNLIAHDSTGSSLLNAYARLAELEASILRVQAALEVLGQQNTTWSRVPNVDSFFLQVHNAMGKLEERLWSALRNFMKLAQNEPRQLIIALQIIETQESVDVELISQGQGKLGGLIYHLSSWELCKRFTLPSLLLSYRR